ncbi:hypothetical protein V3519_10285 [Acinetobacter variabilis]|uniref:hypothetical protein n=1 Tax=Acinetobacter variabilis TaxID=70346 RepID=UPI0030FBE534
MVFLKKTKIIFILVIALIGISEVFLRFKGAIDFPLYQAEPNGHYSLIPNQQGKFLNKNEWFVNSSGFNNDREIDSKKPYIMLVGDSVVYGGNPINYKDRIGYTLEKELSQNVYVGALGGWSLYNEMQFINKNIGIAKNAEFLVIQYDNGDLTGFAKLNPNGVTHPTEKPQLATYYYLQKYVYPKLINKTNASELPSIPEKALSNGDWEKELLEISKNIKGKILFVLYPDKKALADKDLWDDQTYHIKKFINENKDKFDYIDIVKIPEWNSQLYRDGIHPSNDGNQVIANVIANYIKQ